MRKIKTKIKILISESLIILSLVAKVIEEVFLNNTPFSITFVTLSFLSAIFFYREEKLHLYIFSFLSFSLLIFLFFYDINRIFSAITFIISVFIVYLFYTYKTSTLEGVVIDSGETFSLISYKDPFFMEEKKLTIYKKLEKGKKVKLHKKGGSYGVKKE